MKMRTLRQLSVIQLLLVLLSFGSPQRPVRAQMEEVRRPIDMMIVIDNSCSMFPADKIVKGCEVWGNDPDFLRIIGADLFIARLGFDEVNETAYQAGVISLGKTPRPISSLQPLSGTRDSLAGSIANPAPELATGIVPALESAYRELRESPNRRRTNLPAIVLITDGIPYPREGQSDADIERLVSENSDIPLFTMLLQAEASEEYERYIRFWEQMETRYAHIFAYRIGNAEQIEETYNAIVAQMQNTVPTEGIPVAPGDTLSVFVSRYVQKIIVTIIHETEHPKGTVTIHDPKGTQVLPDSDPGVAHFRGRENPVEVVSISTPRLEDDLKEGSWTITSDAPVIVFLDRQGAYRINFLAPAVSLTDITNVYLATERHTSSRDLVIQFNLLDTTGKPVTDSQPIHGQVVFPDGQEVNLRIPADLRPDDSGMYEIRFAPASEYPPILDQPGRFTFTINAGSADDRARERMPIATARLLVDIGRGCYIETVAPHPFACTAGQPAEMTVTLGDYETCLADTIQVRVFGDGKETMLSAGPAGTFTGDVTDLCTPLPAGLACSTQQDAVLRVRMTAQLVDGSPMPPTERDIPVKAIAPACTPTHTPSPTPTPSPPPTPIPDRDGDGWNDLEDTCPDTPGLDFLHGCPPPIWLQGMLGLLGVGVLAFIIFWLWPWVKVHTIAPPPKGYVLVCRAGDKWAQPKSVYGVGMDRRTNKVTIGGDRRKAHIYMKGLKPVEFVVEQQEDRVVLLEAEKGILKGTFSDTAPTHVSTSSPDITLRICLDRSRLKC